jgi:hypothetical protein
LSTSANGIILVSWSGINYPSVVFTAKRAFHEKILLIGSVNPSKDKEFSDIFLYIMIIREETP